MDFHSPRHGSSRTLLRTLTGICQPLLRQGVRRTQADRYVKRYGTAGFAIAWVSYFLLQLHSLRELQVYLSLSGALQQVVGWAGISKAQLNRLHHARPSEVWEPLVSHLLKRLQGRALPSRIRLLDTSFFTLSTRLLKRRYPHKRMRPGTAGIKMGIVLDPTNWLPVRLCSRVGQDCDTGWLDELVPPGEDVNGVLFLFDRGFRKYAFFERLIAGGADFLTRATAQIHYTVIGTIPLDPAQPAIVSDQRVILGSVNGHNLMTHPVRRIELAKQVRRNRKCPVEQLVFLTSDLETPAWELCELYRQRWEIETFFRWYKRTIGCQRPLGYSAEAAAHSFWAALVVYFLVLLVHQATHATDRNPAGATQSAVGLQTTFQRIRALLHQKPPQDLLQALEGL
jgi:hypothetical protein